jgi:hypothetical protein
LTAERHRRRRHLVTPGTVTTPAVRQCWRPSRFPAGRSKPAALLRRLRLAAATLLKVWLEAVAKMVVQRDRPAETLPDVILRGQSAPTG